MNANTTIARLPNNNGSGKSNADVTAWKTITVKTTIPSIRNLFCLMWNGDAFQCSPITLSSLNKLNTIIAFVTEPTVIVNSEIIPISKSNTIGKNPHK